VPVVADEVVDDPVPSDAPDPVVADTAASGCKRKTSRGGDRPRGGQNREYWAKMYGNMRTECEQWRAK